MQDFFGNKIDVEKVGEPARFEFPLLVRGLELNCAFGKLSPRLVSKVLDSITLIVKTEGASFQIMLNSVPLFHAPNSAEPSPQLSANNLMDELIAPSPEPCVYGFISPIDNSSLITAPSLPKIKFKAKIYIGREDGEGEIITQLQILKIQQIEIVK